MAMPINDREYLSYNDHVADVDAAQVAHKLKLLEEQDHRLRPSLEVLDFITSRANCHDKTELFYGKLYEREDYRTKREAAAKAICARCVVIDVCRTYARRAHEYGVWGGETEKERSLAIRRYSR